MGADPNQTTGHSCREGLVLTKQLIASLRLTPAGRRLRLAGTCAKQSHTGGSKAPLVKARRVSFGGFGCRSKSRGAEAAAPPPPKRGPCPCRQHDRRAGALSWQGPRIKVLRPASESPRAGGPLRAATRPRWRGGFRRQHTTKKVTLIGHGGPNAVTPAAKAATAHRCTLPLAIAVDPASVAGRGLVCCVGFKGVAIPLQGAALLCHAAHAGTHTVRPPASRRAAAKPPAPCQVQARARRQR